MRRAKLCIATVATVVLAAAVGVAGAPAESAKRATPTVTVADDFFAPDSVKIKKGKKVKWVWDDLNGNPHNVRLTGTRPKGVKKDDFKSPTATINETFAAKFKKTGKYGFKCSIHPTVMKMTVQVKKN
jgi:plastocyanin